MGSLLGDGSLRLHEPYRNARFSFRHTITQREYFSWKVNALREISSSRCVWEQPGDGYPNAKEKLRYQSLALESLTELYRLTHDGKQFRIRRKWLNMLTPLSLAIWWFDDGSLIANTRKGVLCTDGFPREEIELLSRYLAVVWKVRAHVGAVGTTGRRANYYRLWFRSTEELKKFMHIILPFVPVPAVLPKVMLLYNDPQLQQRWISEVHDATRFPINVINTYVAEKRSRWKQFRE